MLEHVDFGYKYFTCSLPLSGKNQHKLKVAKLNNNQFRGGTAADTKEMTSLDALLFSSNKITGSLDLTIKIF